MDRWRARHASFFAGVADEARQGTRSRDQVAWFDRLDADHENFKAASIWAADQGTIETAARIADGLWWFWLARGHGATGLLHLRALVGRSDVPPLLRVGLLTGRSPNRAGVFDWIPPSKTARPDQGGRGGR